MCARRSERLRLEKSAPLFAALGDATRLSLITRLCDEGPASIATLTEATRVTRQAVTKHLEVLAAAGLVRDRKAGRERLWVIDPKPLSAAQASLAQISRQWDAALDRLEALLADD